MIAVVQRARSARVALAEDPATAVGEIERGLLVLLGVERGDGAPDASWMANKLANLRVFPDAEGRMNRSVRDVEGAVLLVSQFTLCGDCRRGHRPSFVEAEAPEVAEPLVEAVAASIRAEHGVPVETGRFRREMLVSLVNEGPVTLVLRSREPRG